MRKTLSNFIYQSIFQITKILLPIITVPIVSNALGPEGIGTYNYTNSIAQYFVLFAGLGIGVYGNREIAVNRDNKEALSKTFWELFGMSFIISVVSLVAYLVIVSRLDNSYYYYLQSLIIIAAIFDVSWFFMGIEDFKLTTISSMIAQIVSFILIVIFINDSNDVGKYILIQGLNILVSQMIMWMFVIKKINFVKIKTLDLFKHFFPSLSFFVPKIAIVLYTTLNKTLLGLLDSNTAVGYYTNTLMLNGIIITLITTLDLVLLPKFSNLVSKGNGNTITKFMKTTVDLQLFFSIPAMFGLILITPNLVPSFFGDNFLFIKKTIPLVSPLVVIVPLGMAVGRQYLVPMNRIKPYNIAVINGAIISVVTNLLLIPKIGIYGAIIATVLAEIFVTGTRVTAFIKETGFLFNFFKIFKYFSCGIFMLILTNFLTCKMSTSLLTVIIQIIIGIIIYIFITGILRINPIVEFLFGKYDLRRK